MTLMTTRRACLLTMGLAVAPAALAEGLASSASSAGSASVGSLSDSIHRSSHSSSGDGRQVAEGDYRIVQVAELADRPELRRLRLQPAKGSGDDGGFLLDLPQRALVRHGVAAAVLVQVRHRPYGLEFARADTREAFFLVLADDWHRELDPRALSL
ncbi:hypothetical protein [Ideonella sp. A 288]|uniref:hypothetical protein n=1 Tax=Ideonella sp. A 288 TaxID=1962181 RepID=UPI000B4BA251|nr:hypothetical protein [Ideonella sp. A 288]